MTGGNIDAIAIQAANVTVENRNETCHVMYSDVYLLASRKVRRRRGGCGELVGKTSVGVTQLSISTVQFCESRG